MSLLLRALARAVGVVWTLLLALLALGIALYCLDGLIQLGSLRPDRLLHLTSFRRHVGHFLSRLAAPGSTAGLALLGGLVVMLIGLLLLSGIFRSPKEREAVLSSDAEGRISARKRTLKEITRNLAEGADGVAAISRPRLRLSHRANRGKLKLRVARVRTSESAAVKRAVSERVEPVAKAFNLRTKVAVRLGQEGDRVQ